MIHITSVHADVNSYASLQLPLPQDEIRDFDFDGTYWGNTWVPLQAELVAEESYEIGDFASLETVLGVLVCSDEALVCLLPVLSGEVEILPLAVKNSDHRYSILNPLNVIDCLDEPESMIVRSVFSGRIIAIEEYKFLEKSLSGVGLFKIPQTVTKTVFATDLFYNIVRQSRLTGLEFRHISRVI